jgi:hypothetical protein
MNTTKIENKEELIGFLRSIGTECRFVTVDTETVVKNMPKTGNPYHGTVKIARRNGFVNADFTKACEKRYAELHGLKPSEVEYTPGNVWYHHVMTAENKPMCLCEGNKPNKKTGKIEKYMQFFSIRNLGETVYVHPTIGKLTKAQIEDMNSRMYADNSPDWKPGVITLAIDSIRTITFRKVRLQNDTATRLAGTLARWKKTRVSTQPAALPTVEAEVAQ